MLDNNENDHIIIVNNYAHILAYMKFIIQDFIADSWIFVLSGRYLVNIKVMYCSL